MAHLDGLLDARLSLDTSGTTHQVTPTNVENYPSRFVNKSFSLDEMGINHTIPINFCSGLPAVGRFSGTDFLAGASLYASAWY
jgi:hypothetical protein